MNITIHHATSRDHGPVFWFVRHLLAMTVAMLLGMAVYAIVLGLALGFAGSDVEAARLGQPELFALGMAFSMSVPMVAWMRRPFRDVSLAYSYPNLRSLALGLPPSDEPAGAAFNYNPYHPLLLGMILERTTHRPVARYLQEKIWQPLGMEYPASWSLDSETDGFEKMESGLNARAIDFAKFGLFFLEGGNWNGKQVISKQWVTDSTAPDPDDHRPFLSYADWKAAGGYYKYMWWGMPTADGRYYYTALGHLGQLISVFPEDRLVIVRFGREDGGVMWDDVVETVAAKARCAGVCPP
jgi:CubicO group peptidase (beta-lactamase class C family)